MGAEIPNKEDDNVLAAFKPINLITMTFKLVAMQK